MKLPQQHYPSGGLNPLHAVQSWRYVRRLARSALRGEDITPILYEGQRKNGKLLAGTHRYAANELLRAIGRDDVQIAMVCIDELDEQDCPFLTDLREAVSDQDYALVDELWDRQDGRPYPEL